MKSKQLITAQDAQELKESVTKSEIVFSGQYLQIWRDHVLLSNKQPAFREYIKHPGAAMTIPLLANGRILMIKQYRHSVGEIFLEFPAGKKDSGESSEQTARRELQEEIGRSSKKITYLTRIHPVIGYANEHIDLFVAEDLEVVAENRDHDELLNVVELSVDELEQAVWSGLVTDVKTQIGFFWLKRFLEKK